MDVSNNLDGIRSLLGVNSSAAPTTQAKNSAASTLLGGLGGDQATLSSAASQVSQAAGDDGVRWDKVAQIQAALASGTYSVPASAVASRMVDSMLAGGR